MSSAVKLNNINTHIVDVLGSTKGRDQPIMKMDKAVELVDCLETEILSSDEYVFFDPFCKAGEILLAAALISVLNRNNKKIISQEAVEKELYYSNRFFALAPDERHYYLSKRTFCGNEKSHQEKHVQNIRNGNYLSEEDGRLNKEKFQKELESMLEYIKQKIGNKKIIAIGNPPYQEQYSGDVPGARNVFNIFTEFLIQKNEICQTLLVIPSRWYSGGRGLDNFRNNIFNSRKVKLIKDFEISEQIFPTVQIKGGICFFLHQRDYQGKTYFSKNGKTHKIDLYNRDFFIRDINSHSIVERINKKSRLYVSSVAWSWNPFGLNSNYFDVNREDSRTDKTAVKCLTKDRNQRIKIVKKNRIRKNVEKINKYQVVCPKAISRGGIPPRPDQFLILKKNEICTATFNVIHSFNNLKEAKNFLEYCQTDFARFLISLLKITHDMIVKTWRCVPLMNVNESWNDEKLFKHFGLTRSEQNHIKSKAKEW